MRRRVDALTRRRAEASTRQRVDALVSTRRGVRLGPKTKELHVQRQLPRLSFVKWFFGRPSDGYRNRGFQANRVVVTTQDALSCPIKTISRVQTGQVVVLSHDVS